MACKCGKRLIGGHMSSVRWGQPMRGGFGEGLVGKGFGEFFIHHDSKMGNWHPVSFGFMFGLERKHFKLKIYRIVCNCCG